MQTIYISLLTGAITTVEPDVDKIVEAYFPEGVDGASVSQLVLQVLQQLQLKHRGIEPPDMAYRLSFGGQ